MDHKPIAHHFAPRFYLKAFSCDPPERGHVWVYQRGATPARRSVNRTAMEADLYAFTQEDGRLDNHSVESVLQRIDGAAAVVMRKVHQRETLSSQERRQLCVFVSRMLRGTPAHRHEVEHSATAMMPGFFDKYDDAWLRGMVERRHGSGPDAQSALETYRRQLEELRATYLAKVPDHLFPHEVVRPSVIEDVLFDMDWALFMAQSSAPFITSDNAVVYSRGPGLGNRERGLILFPLSPELCLQGMWCTTYQNRYVTLSAQESRGINRYIVQNAHTEIYAHILSPRLSGFVDKWAGTELGTRRSH